MEMSQFSSNCLVSGTCSNPTLCYVVSFFRESRKARQHRRISAALVAQVIAYIRLVYVGLSLFSASDRLFVPAKVICLGSSNASMLTAFFTIYFSGDSWKVVSSYTPVHRIFCRRGCPPLCFRFMSHAFLAEDLNRISPPLPSQLLLMLSGSGFLEIRLCFEVSEQAPIYHAGYVNCSGIPLFAHWFSGVLTTPPAGQVSILPTALILVSITQESHVFLSRVMSTLADVLLNLQFSLLGIQSSEMDFVVLMILDRLQRISSGFTGAFILLIMPYFSFVKNSLLVGSPIWSTYPFIILPPFSSEEQVPPPYSLSMKRDDFPNSPLSFGFSFLVNEGWFPTSLYVTIFRLLDFVEKAISTHSSSILNSLSASYEELSQLFYIVVLYLFNQRGCIIPSNRCNQAV